MLNARNSFVLAAVVLFLGGPVAAQPDDVHVPPPLESWRAWVLQGEEFRECPFFMQRPAGERASHVCAWPGVLVLSIDQRGGAFSQAWTMYDDGWVALPGDGNTWPLDVRVDDQPIAVVERGNRPFVHLQSGDRRLAGAFRWSTRPAGLTVPVSTGLLSLQLDDEQDSLPDRGAETVWLGQRERAVEAQEKVDVEVYRLLQDGVPVTMVARLQLDVSGPGREIVLGTALLPGFVPMRLDSALPARLEADGRLRLQVRPGNWELTLTARADGQFDSYAMSASGEDWPANEIWSYRPDNRLRLTAAESTNPVDPSQVGVPDEWSTWGAFRMAPGRSLQVVERQRGLSDRDANRLSLHRRMWLGFAGRHLTMEDHITGSMRRRWRLDMVPPYQVASARSIQDDQNLLITQGAEPGWTGIELRHPQLNIEALSRIEDHGSRLPVSGWNEQFDEVTTTLSLPPGFRLLAAPGSDQAAGAWLERWRLLDLFLVLLIAVAAGRLVSRPFGALTLVMMALTYQEPFAPAWGWVNLLVAIALAHAAPQGHFRNWSRRYRMFSFIVVLAMAAPFAASQVRMAIFPQLERGSLFGRSFADAYGLRAPASMARRALDEASRRTEVSQEDLPASHADAQAYVAGQTSSARDRVSKSLVMGGYAPNTLVQTGPGRPQWSWNTYRLHWSGPVLSSEDFRLVILPRWLVTLWRLLGVLLLVAVLAGLARRKLSMSPRRPAKSAAPAAAVVAALSFLMGSTPATAVEIPDAATLNQLKQRLTQPPECQGRCAEFSVATIEVSPQRVDMTVEVHALARVAVPLPGLGGSWEPAVVRLDDQPRRDVLRTAGGVMWIEVSAGVHQLRLSGPLTQVDSQEIRFTERPHRVQIVADGWDTTGIANQRLLADAIGLTRIKKAGATDSLASDRFPTFVKIVRQFSLDLDWTVVTTVERRAPNSGAITIELPLLIDEFVDSDGIEIRDGKVLAPLGNGINTFQWTSQLPWADALQLEAPAGSPWTETWQLITSPTWHVEYAGVPEVEATGEGDGYWVAEFDPLPGEKLAIDVTRPEGVKGTTLAIDDVFLTTRLGKRAADTELQFTYRSTQGRQHPVQLPPDAAVLQMTVDGLAISLQPEAGILPLSIEPGEHQVAIAWRGGQDARRYNRTPSVNLNSPASNLRLRIEVPEDRWILFARGPSLGPVVQYWSELIIMIGVALLLGRVRRTPLKTRDWLLLGVGLSTFNWAMLMVFAGWLFVMDFQRQARQKLSPIRFNAMQVFLGLASIIVLSSLLVAVPDGLLGTPDMQIVDSDGQSGTLNWFQDQSDGKLPTAGVISAPLWVYKVAILVWALWLSFALIRWLPWAWRCFSEQGIWRGRHKNVPDSA